MLSRFQFVLLTTLGVVSLSLFAANVALSTLNRDAQAELVRQQQFIAQTVPLENLYREMVKALAEAAVKDKDRSVLDMLSAQGMTVSVDNPVPKAVAPVRLKPDAKK